MGGAPYKFTKKGVGALSSVCRGKRDIRGSTITKYSGVNLIGASLSEPHTSMTALRMCVCMSVCLVYVRPYTENFK